MKKGMLFLDNQESTRVVTHIFYNINKQVDITEAKPILGPKCIRYIKKGI